LHKDKGYTKMKKIMAVFSGVLFASSLLVAPVSAMTSEQLLLQQTIYAACDQIYSDDPTAILQCNGRR
jgi:uncharacterized membrane protein YqgA involved in biofilm formation